MKKFLVYLLALPIVVKTIAWSKRLTIPGFDRIPLYDVVRFFVKAISKGMITTRASAVAFSFFLALFPGIIFLFSLIPYIPIENFQAELLANIQAFLPTDAYEMVSETITDLVTHQRGSVLSFGFIFTIYFASNGIARMMGAFNQSIYAVEKRNFITQRLVAFALLFILTILIVSAIGLIVFQDVIIQYLVTHDYISNETILFWLDAASWLVIIGLFYLSISFIYFLGPAGTSKWRFFSVGSSFATLLLIIVSLGFAYFVNNFGRFNTLYGSIGSLIVLMLWMNWVALILLTGFELNASIKSGADQEHNSLAERVK